MRRHGNAHSWTARQLNMNEIPRVGPEKLPRHAVPVRGSRAVGSGVAQAQECISPRQQITGVVRAEGITEVVADIELRCGRPTADLGFLAINRCSR